MADFLFVAPSGEHLWLELKRRGGTLSDNQKIFRSEMLMRNVRYAVAHSFDEAVDILTGWGALRHNCRVMA